MPGVSEKMDEHIARNKLELEALKITSRNHIIYGILLFIANLFFFIFFISIEGILF